MKHILTAAMVALSVSAVPAHAMMGNCPLCALGEVLNGMQQPQQPQYYAPPPVYRQGPVEFHDYTFPNGQTMNCMTYGGRVLTMTDCN